VAGVGAGYFSRFQYNAWKRIPEVDLVANCNRTTERGQEIARLYDVPKTFTTVGEMLDQVRPDLLDIITPPITHLAAIKEAAARGIDVICQKPFTPDLKTAREAVEIAEEAGILLVVHESFRFQPWYMKTKQLLSEGAVGEPYQVTVRLRPGDGQGPEAYLSRQPYFQKMERFLIHETGIHFIDTFRYFFGEVTSVYARLRRLNPAIAGEDAGYVLFDFESGQTALFDGNRLVDHDTEFGMLTMGEMLLEGSDAVLRLDGYGRLLLRPRKGSEREIPYDWKKIDFAGDSAYNFQRYVIDRLLAGEPIVNKGRDYLRNIVIEEAVYESSETGKRIAV
jgi:predicted dehydrogenase